MDISTSLAFIPYNGHLYLSNEASLYETKILNQVFGALFPLADDMGNGVSFPLDFPSGTRVRTLATAFAEGISLPELKTEPLPALEARHAHVLRLGQALYDAATMLTEQSDVLTSSLPSLRFLEPDSTTSTVLYADDADRGQLRLLHGLVARQEVSWLNVTDLAQWLHTKVSEARRFLGEIETEIRLIEKYHSTLESLDQTVKVRTGIGAIFYKKMDDFELGLRYLNALGTDSDFKKADEYLSRFAERLPITLLLEIAGRHPGTPRETKLWQHIAERGYAPILLALGEYYIGKKDWSRARDCLEKAVSRGETRARAKLATLIMERRFRDIDYMAAVELMSGYENDVTPKQCLLMAEYLRFRGHKAKSIHWLQQGAERGDPEAQYRLGECLLMGRGLARSIPKALDYWRKAGENYDHKRALFSLGECYWHGEVIERNTNLAEGYFNRAWELVPGPLARMLAHEQTDKHKAFHWLKTAADKGDADAQFDLAKYFKQHNNQEDCLNLLRKAAVQKHVAAMSLLGRSLLEQEDPQKFFCNEALLWLRMAADKGDAETQLYLGKCLLDGSKISKNEAEAIEWIQKAAAQNHARAFFQLGVCYDSGAGAAMLESGRGIGKNRVKAAKYYRQAAEAGHPPAMEKMGDFAINGLGMKKNPQEGIAWYEKAYAAKNLSAQKKLGLCLFYGKITPKDMQRAEELLHHTPDIAPEIQFELGVFCQKSPSRLDDAVYWFELSAKQDYEEAQYLLALCLADGRGTMQDMARAEKMIRPFATRLTGERQYLFGAWCQQQGLSEMAVFWYELAVEKENGDAQFALALCLADGRGTPQDLARAEDLATPFSEYLNADYHFAFGAWCQKQNNPEKAVFWYELGAEQNHNEAQYALTLCLADGYGTQQDMKRAEGMASVQAHRYTANYQFRFGTWCLRLDYPNKAVFWFELAVKQDHVEAQYALALCLADGRGTKKNMKRAERLIRPFSDRLSAERQFQFASWCLQNDERKNAVFWLEKACDGGNTDARYALGICLYNGYGATKNIEQAEILLSSMPERPPGPVQYGLGEDCRQRGLYEKALTWYKFSANNKHPNAQEFLGSCYLDGFENLVQVDLKKAEQLFFEAARGFQAKNPGRYRTARKCQKRARKKRDKGFYLKCRTYLLWAGGILGGLMYWDELPSVSALIGIFFVIVALQWIAWLGIRFYTFCQYSWGKFSL